MKKIIIIFLFILFALPIPIAVIPGSWGALFWIIICILSHSSFIEILSALFGGIISITYPLTYTFSLYTTWKEKKLSIKTFLPAIHCILAFLYLLSLKPTAKYISDTMEHFGFAKKDFIVIEENDTHGGFHGDGSYYLILDCSENRGQALEKIEDWNELPLSENLNLIMYGGKKDDITYSHKLAKEAHIPKVENGYYMFEDRHLDSKNSKDDAELLGRGSYNFSIGIYDCDTDKMYYFEFDT